MPPQQSQQLDKGPNTSLLVDELQKQWHDRLNMHLGNILIRPASNRKVWWSCDQCPDNFPHIWDAIVKSIAYLLDRPEFKHYEGLASLFANRADDRQWKQ